MKTNNISKVLNKTYILTWVDEEKNKYSKEYFTLQEALKRIKMLSTVSNKLQYVNMDSILINTSEKKDNRMTIDVTVWFDKDLNINNL